MILFDEITGKAIQNFDPPGASVGSSFSSKNAVAVTSVGIVVQKLRSSDDGTFTVELRGDSNGTPGGFLNKLGEFRDSSLALNTPTVLKFATVASVSQNTRYWIVVSQTLGSTSATGWAWTSDVAGPPDSSHELFQIESRVSTNLVGLGSLMMQIQGDSDDSIFAE